MTIDFTKEEANALMQLLDLACKAGGLQVAEAAIYMTKKIQPATFDGPSEPLPLPVEKKTKNV